MARSIEQLRAATDEELIAEHDQIAEHTDARSVNYYLNELTRRQGERMEQMTTWIMWCTVVVTMATIVNVVAFIVSL